MSEQIINVSEFNKKIKMYLEKPIDFKNISVKGEIANLTYNKVGHIYFSLKDSTARIECAIWKFNAYKFKNLNPIEGDEIIAIGSISYYEPTGKVTFTVVDIKIDGIGELAILYEKRKRELEQLGWFSNENKKNIIKKPLNIGIVTAATGAAVNDLITTIKRRYPIVNIYIFPALVQGEQAAEDIAKKIKLANNFHLKLDTLIVGRGGGSYEDLWSFNEMPVLEAIHKSNIPIISAVGHEPDNTISDLVADARASTPTAAGELATPDKNNLIKILDSIQKDFGKIVLNKLNLLKKEINLSEVLIKKDLKTKFENIKIVLMQESKKINTTIINKLFNLKDYLFNLENKNKKSLYEKFKALKNDFDFEEKKINILNPKKPLEKGFVILKQNKNIIYSVNDIDKNNNVTAILKNGNLDLKILKIDKEK
ncbi:exodeoxyribonuclease VII large subunit [Spiroplasma tabanidicola]|uniref:Exodeoxyribonuclease 7 large subunit n=1 Tax=Spiroplasma tabanidicola TaxID=324079 RepID=A0A6I6CAK1_9MOLU|nr:exodeoxyribonuclease VII large subunit [Spiroplasma tabanidicola]QGS51945.1 exodeoxyribonuclease VII large subunit [Spiroplasma tabanidicola]